MQTANPKTAQSGGNTTPTPDTGTACNAIDAEQNAADIAALDFDAALTLAQVQTIEENQKAMGQARRLCLAALTKSKTELLEGWAGNDAALLEVIDSAKAYLDSLQGMAEMANTAHIRLLTVGMALTLKGAKP